MLRRVLSSALTAYVIMFVFTMVAILSLAVAEHNEHADSRRNHQLIAQVIADRDEARVTTCLQYNVTERVQIASEKKESHDFVSALVNGSTDPALIARVAKFNTEHDKLIMRSHPLRDCSTSGIAKYLANPKA